MKNFKLNRLLGLALIGGLSALGASTAHAAAGETISNTATINFTVGGGPATSVDSNQTDFVEDNLVNFVVATTDPVAGVPAAPSATGAYLTFTVTNNGNGAQDFALSALELVDDFDVNAGFIIVVDDPAGASPGVYDAGDTATFIDELPSDPGVSTVDNVATVFIVSTIPAVPTVADNDIAAMTLVAEVRAGDAAGATGALGGVLANHSGDLDDTTLEQNVFNDPAGDLTALPATADVIQNGLHSDTSQYLITAATMDVLKAQNVIWDPVNGNVNPKAIPGAYVQYTLTVSNTGAASGNLTTLVDDFAASNLALDLNLLDGALVQAVTNAVGDSFQIDTTGTARPSRLVGPELGVTYCTADDAADTDNDGCAGTPGAGGDATVDFSGLGATDVEDLTGDGVTPDDYTAGEIKPGDSIVVKFNAIVN